MAQASLFAIPEMRSEDQVKALRENEKLKGWDASQQKQLNFVERYYPSGQVPAIIYFQVSLSDIKSMWVAEAGRSMQRWFEMAQEAAPSVIFFDEGEVYLSDQGQSGEHNRDPIAAFKAKMEGSEGLEGVFVILATNHPDMIDTAIQSRFSAASVEVSLPDQEARLEILQREIGETFRKQSLLLVAKESDDAKKQWQSRGEHWFKGGLAGLMEIVSELEPGKRGYWSGRDIKALVQAAAIESRRRSVAAAKQGQLVDCTEKPESQECIGGRKGLVRADDPVPSMPQPDKTRVVPSRLDMEDFRAALKTVKPTTSQEDIVSQALFNASRQDVVEAGKGDEFQKTVNRMAIELGRVDEDAKTFGRQTTIIS